MLKYIGLGAVVAVTSGFGIMLASAAGKRVDELSAILRAIGEIETRIRFEQTELKQIIDFLAGNPEYAQLKFLPGCGEHLAREGFGEAFARSAEAVREEMNLTASDWKLISSFAATLGATDLEGQLSNCRTHAELISERLTEAKKEKSEKSRLYISLGVSAGLAVCIFLI